MQIRYQISKSCSEYVENSFVDDMLLCQGFVHSRAALLLLSVESQRLTQGFEGKEIWVKKLKRKVKKKEYIENF